MIYPPGGHYYLEPARLGFSLTKAARKVPGINILLYSFLP
jgi:hypothetical protein